MRHIFLALTIGFLGCSSAGERSADEQTGNITTNCKVAPDCVGFDCHPAWEILPIPQIPQFPQIPTTDIIVGTGGNTPVVTNTGTDTPGTPTTDTPGTTPTTATPDDAGTTPEDPGTTDTAPSPRLTPRPYLVPAIPVFIPPDIR